MNISEITSQKEWSDYYDSVNSLSFHHSWEWGEFEKSIGYAITRLGIYDNKILTSIALVVKIKSKRGNFLFIPHGPIFNFKDQSSKIKDIVFTLQQYLIDVAKTEKFSFIRIAPVMEDSPENRKIYANLEFKTAPIYMHAERTWVLDISKTEEELLQGMRKTHRYLVKRADRDGIIVEKRSDKKALDIFLSIYKKTADREHFIPFSDSFIQKEYEIFYKEKNCELLLGKVENVYLAAMLILFTKSSGFYHQGASIHTKLPVTYKLQWEAIKEAKKRGCTLYNFWGILQKGRSPKNWQGLTLFKTGFGGRQIDYVPTQDYIVSPKYYLTFVYELYLGWKRGV